MRKYLKSLVLKIVGQVIFFIAFFPPWAIAGLTVTDNNTGIERTVSVESTGQFRLVFEAADNWGITQWYDLVNDPTASVSLTHMYSHYPDSEESALFQQVWYGTTPNDPKLYIMAAKYDWPGSVETLTIIENTLGRVVVETSGHPMLAAGVLSNLTVAVRYNIYPDGKIYIQSNVTAAKVQTVVEWRNSIIGLRDPSYLVNGDFGNFVSDNNASTLTDSTKKWIPNQWTGYRVDQKGYNSWEIASNSNNSLKLGKRISGQSPVVDGPSNIISRFDKFGWIRATDIQDPYNWHRQRAKYLFEYWDPSTPAPYHNWTNASIMLVPNPSNPHQGWQAHHDWKGFKRFYYHTRDVSLKEGESIIQHYYMQLGTKGSSLLPDLSKRANTDRYANDYLGDHSIKIETGALRESGFDNEKGCYTLTSHNNITTFSVDGSTTNRIKPVFQITGISPDVVPVVSLDGKILRPETDYVWHNDNKGMLLVQLFIDINSQSIISIRPTNSATSSSLMPLFEKESIVSTNFNDATAQPSAGMENSSNRLQRYAILSYSNDAPKVASWIDQKFAYKIGGNKPANPDINWMTYFDIYGTATLGEYLTMKDFAVSNEFFHENMLLHSQKNFTAKIPVAFREMDRFDVFEGKNGVLRTKDFKTFDDLSAKAYKGIIPLSDALYIGYEEPFAEVNWEFEKTGRQVSWLSEFWNGSSWLPLTISDGTEGFSRKGQMTFIPPSNWQPLSVNSSRPKYFIRLIFRDADTDPISSRIYGDNWLNEKSNSCRGWNEKDPGVVNAGPLAFNPIAPADASAKFRYQARIPFWSSDHFVANPSNAVQDGNEYIRTWAKYAAEQILTRALSKGYGGVMCDDGERNVANDGVKPELSDLPAGKDWMQESTAKYGDIVRFVKEVNPKLLLGVNSQQKQMVRQGDWNIAEYNTFVWKTGSAGSFERSTKSGVMAYDDYEPLPGEKEIFGILIYQDTTDTVPGAEAVWDRANRGPIAALSKHFIGMNKNTIFSYYSRGGFVYDETDEVVLKNKKIIHQASEFLPKIEDVYRWGTWFPAMGVEIGSPNAKGHNGGERDTAWKLGKDIGGGPSVWRRDFTNAIVLHRPAFYNTSKAEYDTYCSPLQLETKLYPLRADGLTESAVNEISLRSGEGAILMKHPIVTLQH